MSGPLLFGIATYALMVAAFFLPRQRSFHVPVMAATILFDLLMPFYLVLTNDWYKRLIEQEEIFSFMIWMHFILVLTLYALYGLQVMTVKKMVNGDMEARKEHRTQGVGILIARGLVILSAAMLIDPSGAE
jgi:hypothetical protein